MRKIALTVVVLALSCPALAVDEPRYQLKADEKNIFGFVYDRADGNAEFSVPFDKSYGELTATQQARLKSAYVEMGEADEPPFPVGGLQAIYEPITQGQQRLHASGTFRAAIEIDALGEPISMAVYRSPSKAVTRFVSGIVMLSKFKPARCSGVPCKMGFPIVIGFATR